jgi:hypothetical protein
MDRFSDNHDDMAVLSARQAEEALSRREVTDPMVRKAATVVADLRMALREEPRPEVSRIHLLTLLGIAESEGLLRSRRAGRTTRRRAGGLALAATLLVGGGLAAALTGGQDALQAESRRTPQVRTSPKAGPPADAGGQEHASASAREDPGSDVAAVARDPGLSGCRKGQSVAAVASSNATAHRQDGPRPHDPCARAAGEGRPRDGEIGGAGGSPRGGLSKGPGHGRQTAEVASGGAAGGGASAGGGPPAFAGGKGPGGPPEGR